MRFLEALARMEENRGWWLLPLEIQCYILLLPPATGAHRRDLRKLRLVCRQMRLLIDCITQSIEIAAHRAFPTLPAQKPSPHPKERHHKNSNSSPAEDSEGTSLFRSSVTNQPLTDPDEDTLELEGMSTSDLMLFIEQQVIIPSSPPFSNGTT